jgi:hypothetical protein
MNVYHIIIIFSITALLGVTLLSFVLNNKKRPIFIVALHGIFALVGIGTLYFYSADETMDQNHAPMSSIALLSLAAVAGIFMLVRDKAMGAGVPKWMPFIHGSVALLGYILLWVHTLTK